jgi:hypothetical protein
MSIIRIRDISSRLTWFVGCGAVDFYVFSLVHFLFISGRRIRYPSFFYKIHSQRLTMSRYFNLLLEMEHVLFKPTRSWRV